MKKIILCAFLCLFSLTCFSAPSEIIIIRHADKLHQKEPGPFLSPKGQARAEKFVSYYLQHYPKPDYIFASKPGDSTHPHESPSYRPIQTVAPLANKLTQMSGKTVKVYTPYYEHGFPELAHDLLTNPQYQKKNILIAWQHGKINSFAHDLLVKKRLKKWKQEVYDMVYILKYTSSGKLRSFQILKHQYPVIFSNPKHVKY